MFGLFGKSKRKKEIKSTFKVYGYEIQKFDIDGYGQVDFANWLHPFKQTHTSWHFGSKFFTSLWRQKDQ